MQPLKRKKKKEQKTKPKKSLPWVTDFNLFSPASPTTLLLVLQQLLQQLLKKLLLPVFYILCLKCVSFPPHLSPFT